MVMPEDANQTGEPALSQAAAARRQNRQSWVAYLFAAICTLVITVTDFAFGGLWGNRTPLVAFVLAVTGTALFGGFWPAVLVTALGAIAAAYLFLGAPYNIAVEEPADQMLLLLFVASGVLIAGVSARMHRALAQSRVDREAAEAAHDELERAACERARLLEAEVAERTAALAAHAQLTRTITDNATAALFMLDERGRCTFMNPAAEALTGYSFAEIRERPLHEVLLPSEPGGAECARKLREGALRAHECVIARKGGARFPAQCTASTIVAEGRAPTMVVEVLDLTAQKRIEDEREHLLESERAARAEAERASRQKDEFVATVSHELRTPLNAILGWAHLLRRSASAADQLEKGIDSVERNARLLAQLVSDLLDVSRIMSGKIRLELAPIELASIIEAALEEMRAIAEAKGVALHVAEAPADAVVLGDAARLQQVVWNLMSNAIKFTPRGGRVDVAITRREAQIALTVSDTGQGIAPEFLPHLFERFRQADSSAARQHGGLGLGLSIVKNLVELHGGRITAASAGAGRGATFTMELPAYAAEGTGLASYARVARSGAGGLEGAKILVVEDEPDARDIITRVLAECGASVTAAASAPEALRSLDAECPDILVSDIGMPGMDGYQMIRRIRTEYPSPVKDLPAVALTAFARLEDRAQAIAAGFQEHLPKPVAPSDLVVTVTSLWAQIAGD
jgi:PAS domain S-box-containing protein